MRRTRCKWAASLLAVMTVAVACAPMPPPFPPEKDGGFNPDGASQADVAAYSTRGPNDVGVLTVEIEPGRQAEVWYPAPAGSATGGTPEKYDVRNFLAPSLNALLPPGVTAEFVTDAVRGLPVAPGGPYPLALFSHGAASYRLQSTVLTTHLASWGFVVISPDYFERGLQSVGGTPTAPTRPDTDVADLTFTAAVALNASGALAGAIDTTRLFPFGHSAGGGTSTRLSTRTDVSSWIAMSSGVNLTPTLFNLNPTVPVALADSTKNVMWITGQQDGVASYESVINAYNYSAGEKKLVAIPFVGHNNAMTDICEIARDRGGLVGLALSAGLPLPDFLLNLARDGCIAPPFATGFDSWPVVRHFVTAEMRYRAGLDPEPVGLGVGVSANFGALAPTYTHAE